MKRNEMMENRMNFQTSVELPAGMPSVSHADHILLMGSCFAENIGRQLMDAGFQLDLNPFGILYHRQRLSPNLQCPVYLYFKGHPLLRLDENAGYNTGAN